jgi:hypothetical protein
VRLLCPYCRGVHEWKLTDGLIGDSRVSKVHALEAWSPCARMNQVA